MSRWKPTIVFLNSGGTNVSYNGTEKEIRWKFIRLNRINYPLSIIACRIYGFGTDVLGYGDSFKLKSAMIVSLAEAWERLWLKKVFLEDRKVKSSNGFAAGVDVPTAIKKSKGELLERHILLEAWQSMQGWFPHDIKSLKAKILQTYLHRTSIETIFYKIRTTSKHSCLCVLGYSSKGIYFDCAYSDGDNSSTGDIELKLLKSVLRASYVRSDKVISSAYQLPKIGSPMDHDKFYSIKENVKAFNFLKNNSCKEILNISNFDQINTKVLSQTSSLPSVAYSYNESWPPLFWGKCSIKGKNKWPHPLA